MECVLGFSIYVGSFKATLKSLASMDLLRVNLSAKQAVHQSLGLCLILPLLHTYPLVTASCQYHCYLLFSSKLQFQAHCCSPSNLSLGLCFTQVLPPAVAVGPGLQPPLMLLQLTLIWQVSTGLSCLELGWELLFQALSNVMSLSCRPDPCRELSTTEHDLPDVQCHRCCDRPGAEPKCHPCTVGIQSVRLWRQWRWQQCIPRRCHLRWLLLADRKHPMGFHWDCLGLSSAMDPQSLAGFLEQVSFCLLWLRK